MLVRAAIVKEKANKSSPDECVNVARKVASYIAKNFGNSIKDLPAKLQDDFENFSKKPKLDHFDFAMHSGLQSFTFAGDKDKVQSSERSEI